MAKIIKPFSGDQFSLFDLSKYESISLARQIQMEEIDAEQDAYNEALYQKSVENNLETQSDCQGKNSLTPPLENNQLLFLEPEQISEEPPDPDDYADFDSYSKANNSFWERSLKLLEEKSVWQKQDFEDCNTVMMSVLMSSSVWAKANELYKSRLKLKANKEDIPVENPLPKMRGRPPGSSNKHKSGSFYKRGVNKKGFEQWSFHYHYYDENGKLRKTSISVPFDKLRQAKNIAHFKGTEAVIKFLRGNVSTNY